MVGELLHRADQDVEKAQRGIVFIDEIDKIARRSQGRAPAPVRATSAAKGCSSRCSRCWRAGDLRRR
jgi:hypothetical protein